MPAAVVQALAKRAGKSPKRAEHLWKKAKQVAGKQYRVKEPTGKGKGERFYRLTMGVFKRMIGLREGVPEDAIDERLLDELAADGFAEEADRLRE